MRALKLSACVLMAACALPLAATAQTSLKALSLSESAIRTLYAEGADVHKKDINSMLKYINTAFHDQIQLQMNTTTTVPGQPPISAPVTFNKAEYLAQAQKEYESARTANVRHTVTSVVIAPDGQSAKVTDTSTTSGQILKLPTGQTAIINGDATCDDDVVLGPNGAPQIIKSVCSLNLTVTPQSDL